MRILELTESQQISLIENRRADSDTLWSKIEAIYQANTAIYDGKADWLKNPLPGQNKPGTQRGFTNQEAVINSLIANPPKPNFVPNRVDPEAAEMALQQEKYFLEKYTDLNVKEVIRACLRDLYFSRLFVAKPFWNAKINDFDIKRVDPRKVRFNIKANKEVDSDFAIEDIDSNIWELITKYPKMKADILKEAGITEIDAMIKNPSCCYSENWIGNYLLIKFKNKILWSGKNPYWDWDGILATKEEFETLLNEEKSPKSLVKQMMEQEEDVLGEDGQPLKDEFDVPVRENVQTKRRKEQEARKTELVEAGEEEGELPYEAYLFNHFDTPRKPYIYATVLRNEDGPIGRTSFLEQASSLLHDADATKFQIARNMRMVNGITKVDQSVMSKEKAQQIRYDTNGILWGKGVVNGVVREFGQGLPSFVFQNLEQSLNEVDNIMAATSAFRGEREGQETKAGRLALVEQSFLRLNEMVQLVDFVSKEIFEWWFQLAKVRYTERHYAKFMGPEGAVKAIEFTREDFEKGTQIRIIPGKSLPEDRLFKFQRAQEDVKNGNISNLTYLKEAQYDNPTETAREAYLYSKNPAEVLGIEETPPPSQGVPGPEAAAQPPMPQEMAM